jgi:hypothetical protein
MPRLASSTQTSLPNNSKISGPPKVVPDLASMIGLLLGELGAAEQMISAVQRGDADAAEVVLSRSLRRQPMSLLLSTAVDRNFEWTLFHLIGKPTDEEWLGLGAIVELLCPPTDEAATVAAVTRCLTVTKAREVNETDTEMMLGVFIDELRVFPRDVVITAFRKWAMREKWWPSLAEIIDDCQRMARWRFSLHRIVGERA